MSAKGKEILTDLKRSDWLPPYDEEGVTEILKDIVEVHSSLSEALGYGRRGEDEKNVDEEDPFHTLTDSEKVKAWYLNDCLERNCRYLNSYFNHRMVKIRELRWDSGNLTFEKIRRDILSSKEKDYYSSYNEIISDYCASLDLDLTSSIEPPKDLLIEVRVLQSCGTIMTDNGPVNLNKGSTNFLKRSEIEHLIRDGLVQHVLTEDHF